MGSDQLVSLMLTLSISDVFREFAKSRLTILAQPNFLINSSGPTQDSVVGKKRHPYALHTRQLGSFDTSWEM